MEKSQKNMNELASFDASNVAEVEKGAVMVNSELPPYDSFRTESPKKAEEEVFPREQNSAACIPHGSVSVIGRRRVMEDALTVAPGELALYDFYAVYDGHGGDQVAHACRERLHKLLANEVEHVTGDDGGINWENVMAASFAKMDAEIKVEANEMDDMPASSMLRSTGSTAAVVVVRVDKLIVANCGDSRAVLFRNGAAVPLSRDHKADRPDERARVESAGGNVINWDGYRVLGVLSISRSIGDHFLRPYVIPEPEVTVWERKESDEFLVIASDGLWDVVTNDLACKLVKRCFSGKVRRRFAEGGSESCAMEAASILTELAMARGSKDNISVIVVQLMGHQCLGSTPKKPNTPPSTP